MIAVEPPYAVFSLIRLIMCRKTIPSRSNLQKSTLKQFVTDLARNGGRRARHGLYKKEADVPVMVLCK